jgi:hypothetical protein
MNPFELLKQDHRKVADLMEKLEKTTERGVKTREELFGKIQEELEIHAHIEETIFYPVLQKEKETEDITREAFEEHKVVKTLLAELAALNKDDEQWLPKFTVLKENIEHHVEEEEGEMFTDARKAIEKEELEQLGEQMNAEKSRMMAGATK